MARVDFEPMRRASALLAFHFRKFLLIQFLMSSRQAVRDEGGNVSSGSGGDVNLCVVSVAVEMDPLVSED